MRANQYKQTIKKFITLSLTVLIAIAYLLSFGSARNVRSTSAPQLPPKLELTASSLKDATVSNESRIYDSNENVLKYNPVNNVVYTDKGIAFDNNSMPITYNNENKEFKNAKNERLELIERSTSGLQNYYLMNGEYKVRSIGIDDKLFVAKVKANTAYNKGAEYELLITYTYTSATFWEFFIAIAGHYEYFDLNGHKINADYLGLPSTKYSGAAGLSQLLFKGYASLEYWGTIKDLLQEIIFLTEQSEDKTGYALNFETGDYLRNDFLTQNADGSEFYGKIKIAENNQLVDVLNYPLIGKDARPLWYKPEFSAYVTNKNEVLNSNEKNQLVDNKGFVAHCIFDNLTKGAQIYIIYLADGTTRIPATGKTISISPFEMEFYDLNGVKIVESEIVPPEVSKEDREDKFPKEFKTDAENFFDELTAAFKKWWSNIFGLGISGTQILMYIAIGLIGIIATIIIVFIIKLLINVVVGFIKWVRA